MKEEELLKSSFKNSWNVFEDLPWATKSPHEEAQPISEGSLLEHLPEYQKMSSKEKTHLRFKEEVYHISNLLAGEDKAVGLASQILTETLDTHPQWTHLLSALLFDESKHYYTLTRYLNEKVKLSYRAHPKIQKILAELKKESSFEIKLFVAQVVLEWTATSLLASLFLKSSTSLFGLITKKIMLDETRHLTLNRLIFSHFEPKHFDHLKKGMEDMLFEAIVAIISSFCAIPVWQEFGLSKDSCREYALKELHKKGIHTFYTRVLPGELKRCNLHSDRLVTLLENDLTPRLIKDHWSFEPHHINA